METEQLAHVLRRTTMAAHPSRMKLFTNDDLSDVIDQLIDDCGLDDNNVATIPWDDGPPTGKEDWGQVSVWWTARMASDEAGLQDRMAWLWHSWFTTADESVDGQRLVADQLEILYRYGLSDIPTLLDRVITSGAMLRYLDAADSEAFNPNENLARELMELYTIGPEHYTEDDVRAAARALAGWKVDDEEGTVWFDESAAFVAPLIFLGVQDRWDTAKVLHALAHHPSTHRRVADHLWTQFVGGQTPIEQLDHMSAMLANNDLKILPLVRHILGSEEFAAANRSRYSTTLEWLVGTLAAIDPEGEQDALEPWHLENLGQRPYSPPSPAGWPTGAYWIRPGALLPRLQLAQHIETDHVRNQRWSAESIAATAGFAETDAVIPLLRTALNDDRFDAPDRRQIAWRIAVTCPTAQFT